MELLEVSRDFLDIDFVESLLSCSQVSPLALGPIFTVSSAILREILYCHVTIHDSVNTCNLC
jgi:hypothetical protein